MNHTSLNATNVCINHVFNSKCALTYTSEFRVQNLKRNVPAHLYIKIHVRAALGAGSVTPLSLH